MQDYILSQNAPENWYSYEYPRASMATDQVIFAFDGQKLNVLLVQRGEEPYKDRWAFPGGFLRMDETLEECARRELEEETGLKGIEPEQFGVYSDVYRDPRCRVLTTAYYTLTKMADVQGGSDAKKAQWFPMDKVPTLAFDHDKILRDAMRRLREDLHFRPVGFELLPEEFAIPRLMALYEAILGVHFDRRNFTRRITGTGILNDLGRKDPNAKHNPGNLYSFNREAYEQFKQSGTLNLEF